MKQTLLCLFLLVSIVGYLASQQDKSDLALTNTNTNQLTDIFSIHPNPAINDVRVVLPPNTSRICIISLTGKIVHEEKLTHDLGYQIIDVSDFRRGTYFLRIEGPDRVQTKKLIKG